MRSTILRAAPAILASVLSIAPACKHSPSTTPEGTAHPPAGSTRSATVASAPRSTPTPAKPPPKPATPETVEVPKDAEWRKMPPKPGPPRAPVLPSFKSAKLKNGLTVIVADEKSLLPLVSFEIVTLGGALTDPPKSAGLAALAYGMLGEGAGSRDVLQFSDAVADLGAAFAAQADRDRGAVAIGGLKRTADQMLELLADAVIRPRYEPKDFERRKQQAMGALGQARGSPQGLAFEALPALIYGPLHPYGHPPSGIVETVAKLKLEDVKKARARIMGPSTSALIAAGDITLDQAKALAEKHFGKWNQRVKKLKPVAPVSAKKRTEVVLIQKENAPQTMELIGRPIFGRGHPDEAAMTVLNEIYGGAFSSRLNMNLREDKGYTYGATSQTAYRAGVGVFVALSPIRQDVTAEGLKEMFSELEGLKQRPPDQEEVERAKAGIIRSLPGSFERTAAVASAAESIFVYKLPPDYFQKLGAKYEGVSVDAVRAAAAKYMVPELMQVLLVGDAAVIKEGVEKTNLGKVVVKESP